MKNTKTRRVLYCIGVAVVFIAIAVVMLIIGRGHTVYFDNKTLEYEGTEYTAFHKVIVNVNGEQAAKLNKRDRGMAIWLGQNFKMDLEITAEKDGATETKTVSVKLPYKLDGIVLNLPALLAGLPEEAYLSEFVSLATEYNAGEDEEEPGATDEFGMDDMGDMGDLGDF